MNEQENADGGSSGRHPIIGLILENPISAINTAAIIFGGGLVYSSNENRMEKMETRIVRIEQQVRDDITVANVNADRTTQKVEAITRDLSDVKITVRGIEASVQFLVQQVQQQMRLERRGPQ